MNKKQRIILAILKSLKENKDSVINLRGGRGYASGHPYPKKINKPGLGKIENEEPKSEKRNKIKISKFFKKKRK